MEIFLIWIVVSFIIASYGGNRRIGFFVSLLVCLLLSPLIGFICVALSERTNRNNRPPDNSSGFDINRYRAN